MTFWRGALIQVALVWTVACTAPTPERLLADAHDALADGEPRTAEIHLKSLLQQDPTNIAARVLLGELSLASGDAPAAEHNLQTALELGGDPAEIQLPLLQALLSQNKHTQALELLDAGPNATGTDRVLLLAIRGAAHRGLGQLPEAEAAYKAALEIDPTSASSRTELASVYLQSGRGAEARALVAEVVADQPNFVPALLLSGSIESAAARHESAQALLGRVLEIEESRQQRPQYLAALAQLIDSQLAQRKVDSAAANADRLFVLAPHSAVAGYLKARVEAEQADLSAAERRLEAVIAKDADYWPAYVLLGVINAKQNQVGQAEMYLRRAATGNPSDTRVQLLLAELYIRQDDAAEARALIDSSPVANDGLFLALAGRASLEAGQPELAAEYFARSEQSKPGTLRQLVDVSSVYIAAGELERAIRVLESASFDEQESERVADYLLAFVQLQSGNLTAANAAALRLTDPRPETLNLRGTIAIYGGDLDRAGVLFAQALEMQPSYVPALLNLARVAIGQDRREQAADQLRRALEFDPTQINAIVAMVQLAAGRGDFDEAEAWLARVPESVLRLQLSGDLHFARGQFGDAVADYSRAFGLRPSADLALKSYAAAAQAGQPKPEAAVAAWAADHPNDVRANFLLGSLAFDRGEEGEAVRRYEAVLASEPAHLVALNNLAWIYGERGDARAVDLAARAYAAKPDDPAIADTLGWLHVRRGDVAAGLPILQQAVRVDSDDPEIRYHLAVALADSGDSRQALEMLDALLAGNEEFTGRSAARDLAARLKSGTGL